MATITATDVITRSRYHLSDSVATYRWANSLLCDYWLNDAMRDIWKRRPDSRFAADGTVNTFAEVTCTGETLPAGNLILSDYWLEAISHYVTAQAFFQDGSDENNVTRAKEHFALYKQELVA